MIPKHIAGSTRNLVKPKDWDDAVDGQCVGLPILDYEDPNTKLNWMISSWEPSPKELKALVAGAPIRLYISGVLHPVVGLGVGEVAEVSPG